MSRDMNKQELIKELENCKTKGSHIGEVGVNSGLNTAIDLAKQLDEPKKVVVPKFVAEWIELCKRNATLSECLNGSYSITDEHSEIISVDEDWITTDDNEELLARAWLNGYEVEKEHLYYVYEPTTKQYLGVDKVLNKAFWLSSQNSGARTPLTEQEIKAIDERYWDFAVKVDGE